MLPRVTYGGVAICGTQARQIGPTSRVRALRQTLPGVRGFRIFRLTGGIDSYLWSYSGLISSASLSGLLTLIKTGADMADGQLRNLVDNGGTTWSNVQLVSFQQQGQIQPVEGGCLVWVQATFEQTRT